MAEPASQREIEEALENIPMFDVHSHLMCGSLAAHGAHDILLYHMVISDLYAAGCPDGARLSEFPSVPTEEEAQRRLRAAAPYFRRTFNTSNSWMLRRILKDLYDWDECVDEDNWQRLDSIIRERSTDPEWPDSILRSLNIVRTCTEHSRRGDGQDDHRFQYSLEWGFFTRPRWGEFDAPLYELERCWGAEPGPPLSIGYGERPPLERSIRSADDACAAVADYVVAIPTNVISTVAHISTDINYRDVSREEFEAALARRDLASRSEQDIYSSYLQAQFLTELEARRPDLVYQFSLGAEPLPYETGSRLSQATIGQVAEMAAAHPTLRFNCLVASRHSNQALCSIARELPNFSLSGYWWHNFYPEAMKQLISERLDMLPLNRQIGFFSDAYTIEWVYGKAAMVRRQLAQVLADRVGSGWYSLDDSLTIARAILYESAIENLGMEPRT
jgi:hypothetical protein